MVDLFFKRAGKVLIGLWLSLFLLGCQAALDAGVANSGFDSATGAQPTGWFVSDAARQKGVIEVLERPNPVLRLTPNAANTGGDDPLGVGQALDATSWHGQVLQLSADLAGKDGAAAVVGLVALGQDGQVLSSLFLREKTGTDSELINQVAVADLPLPRETKTLILFASAEGTQGAAYFDNISVSPVPTASPAASASRAVVAATSIQIEPGNPLHPVRRELFGTNVEWIRNANDLWNPRLGKMDPGIVQLGRDAGISMIRFPGGVWSDAYDWRDGVGPQDQRPTTPHVPGDQEQSRHVIGTDEIVSLAKSWNATLVLTVNVGHGTPEMAGAWAAYVRDKFGPSTVALWEIGNELYMKGDLTGGSIGPDVYAERVLAFAKAIRNEIPSAKIAAIGLVNRDRYEFNSYPNWNEVVLARTAGVVDYFAIHNSYAPLVTSEGIRQGEQVYKAMLAAPELIAQNLQQTKALAETSGAGNVGLSVTEWGPFFAIDPKSAYFDHVKTLGSAVFVARTLNAFLRNPSVRSAHFFKLSDVLNMGWIARDGAGGHKATPALQAFSLYSNGLSGTLVNTRIDGPKFETRPTGFVSAVRNAPVIDAVASKNGDTITVLISSADLNATHEVRLDVAGQGKAWRMTQTVLSGRAPDAHNGTRMIDVPGLTFAKPQGFSGTGAFENARTGDVTLDRLASQDVELPITLTIPPHSVVQLRLDPR